MFFYYYYQSLCSPIYTYILTMFEIPNQRCPTFFSHTPDLLFQNFRGPKFSLWYSSSSSKKGLLIYFVVFSKIIDKIHKKVFTHIGQVYFTQNWVMIKKKKRSSAHQFRWILWCSPKNNKKNIRTRFCNSLYPVST